MGHALEPVSNCNYACISQEAKHPDSAGKAFRASKWCHLIKLGFLNGNDSLIYTCKPAAPWQNAFEFFPKIITLCWIILSRGWQFPAVAGLLSRVVPSRPVFPKSPS